MKPPFTPAYRALCNDALDLGLAADLLHAVDTPARNALVARLRHMSARTEVQLARMLASGEATETPAPLHDFAATTACIAFTGFQRAGHEADAQAFATAFRADYPEAGAAMDAKLATLGRK